MRKLPIIGAAILTGALIFLKIYENVDLNKSDRSAAE